MNQSFKERKFGLRKRTQRVLLCLPVGYLIAAVGCASFQRRLIYYPPVFDKAEAQQLGTAAGLERWKDPAGQTLGWKRLSPVQPAQGQVLLLHGNAACALHCGHYADVIQQASALDVFIVEYPGYADHPGKPTELTLYEAAEAGLRSLGTNAPVYLVGESLGTGVASYLAGKHPDRIAGVALLAPYNNLVDVARAQTRILPVKLLLCDRFPSDDHLRTYHGPIAMLVAGRDLVVPERFGRRLYEGYHGPKRLWEFPKGNHGTVMTQPPEIWMEIIGFWQSNHFQQSTSRRQGL